MTKINDEKFYISNSHVCGYLPGEQATDLFVDPYTPVDAARYNQLVINGFRRSGKFFYRPHCRGCSECIPMRVPVDQFIFRRSHIRTLQHNSDLSSETIPAQFDEEQYRLYRKYISRRHSGGGMDKPDVENYISFLCESTVDTRFIEFRSKRRLVALAVTDWLDHGLSAVYTCYEIDLQKRSLGSFAILSQIKKAQELGLKYVYLGYWIKHSKKMSYKVSYLPAEVFYADKWNFVNDVNELEELTAHPHKL